MKGVKYLILIAGLFLTQIFLISCGGTSSNPIEKYSALKVDQTQPGTSDTQSLALDVFTTATSVSQSELIELKINGPNDVNNAQFLENEKGVYYFRVVPKSAKIMQFEVKLIEFPINQKPEIKVTSSPHIFSLEWAPPQGIIPAGLVYTLLNAKIQTTVLQATDPRLIGLTKIDNLNIYVNRDNSVPKILGNSGLESGIDEGPNPLYFTVDIEDTASVSSVKSPNLDISRYVYSNTEAFRVNGKPFIDFDDRKKTNPEKILEKNGQFIGKWRFYFKMQINELPLDRDRRGIEIPLSTTVPICFYWQAESVLETKSIQQQICTVGRYETQVPEVSWNETPTNDTLYAGIHQELKFKMFSSNNLGQITLQNKDSVLSKLSGTKDLQCSDSGECVIQWTPLCSKSLKDQKVSLLLKVQNKLGKKAKGQSFKKDFTVISTAENCPTVQKTPTSSTVSPSPSVASPSSSSSKKVEKKPITTAKKKNNK